MKIITENRLSKRLHGMDKSDLCKMIMKMYESSKTAKVLISQYLGDDAYHKEILDTYIDKVERSFIPSRGMPHPEKAEAYVKEYIQSVCAGNKEEEDYLKACMEYAFVKDGISCICDYGGGSDHLYRVIENYFEDICDYIVSGNDAYRKKFYDLCEDEISGLTDIAMMNGFSPDIEDLWVNTIPEWEL